ncbi:MAG: hypothetical protein IH855_07065 [Bacteroidetes bacterium]|nr:hypothetical protein [Bacteroidota bacterium]
MRTNFRIRYAFLAVLSACLLALTSCDSGEANGDGPSIQDVLAAIQVDGTQASFVNEAFPGGGSGAAPTIDGSMQIVRGGSILLEVTAPSGADRLLIGLDGDFVGYFDAAISGSNTSVVVTNNSSTALTNFDLIVATESNGSMSAANQYSVSINQQAGTSGQLQVSLNWNAPVDLDLHLETPDGEDIYYGNDVGQNGGILDLDSNPACNLDRVDNENISWGDVTPPGGEYTVRVDLWSECAVTVAIPFVVTTNIRGSVNTFSGTFQPSEADSGGAFDGREITQFTFMPASP